MRVRFFSTLPLFAYTCSFHRLSIASIRKTKVLFELLFFLSIREYLKTRTIKWKYQIENMKDLTLTDKIPLIWPYMYLVDER